MVEDLKLEERNGVMYLPNHEEPYTGKYVTWHKNGQKQEEGAYKDGKEDGLATLWYENGQKATEAMHKAGKKNGLATLW